MPKFKMFVAAAAVVAVARIATPVTTPHKAANLGSDQPPPPAHVARPVVTSSILKLDGRLPPRLPSRLIKTASINFVGSGARAMDESVRTILADARQIAQRQSGPAKGDGKEKQPARSKASDPDLPAALDADGSGQGGDVFDGFGLEEDRPPAKETALQQAHPELFIVTCEAGCVPSTNKIVYEVSRVAAPAAEIAKRRLETTAAQVNDGSSGVATAENSVVCIAGCYDPQPSRPATKQAKKSPEPAPERPRVTVADIARPSSRRPTIARHLKPVPAREVRPQAVAVAAPAPLATSAPAFIGQAAPGEIKVQTRDRVKVAGGAKPVREAQRARKARKGHVLRTKMSSPWVTTVATSSPDPAPDAPEPAGWQATVVRSNDETSGAAEAATTWGYFVTVGQ